MVQSEDCPVFETFSADVKAAWKVKHLTRKDLAEKVNKKRLGGKGKQETGKELFVALPPFPHLNPKL